MDERLFDMVDLDMLRDIFLLADGVGREGFDTERMFEDIVGRYGRENVYECLGSLNARGDIRIEQVDGVTHFYGLTTQGRFLFPSVTNQWTIDKAKRTMRDIRFADVPEGYEEMRKFLLDKVDEEWANDEGKGDVMR